MLLPTCQAYCLSKRLYQSDARPSRPVLLGLNDGLSVKHLLKEEEEEEEEDGVAVRKSLFKKYRVLDCC